MSHFVSDDAACFNGKRRDQVAAVRAMLRGSFDPVVRGDDAMARLLAQLEKIEPARR